MITGWASQSPVQAQPTLSRREGKNVVLEVFKIARILSDFMTGISHQIFIEKKMTFIYASLINPVKLVWRVWTWALYTCGKLDF